MWGYLKVQNLLAWFVWYEKLISLDSIYKSRKLMCKLCFFVWWVNVNVVSYTFNVIVNLFKYRSSHRRYFVRKGVLSLKKETLGTVVFVWVLRNFKNTFFLCFLQNASSGYCLNLFKYEKVLYSVWNYSLHSPV